MDEVMERRRTRDRRSLPRTGRRTADKSQGGADANVDTSLQARVTTLESVSDQARRDMDIQFTRIAAMQAEIDRLKAGTERLDADVQRLKARR
jgi:hypothetical protein